MINMTTSQNIQQIDDVRILKDKILKIDSIFALVAEKQRKVAGLESRCKKLQQDNNKLDGRNNELLSEIQKCQKEQERSTNEYQTKLFEDSQKYSMLESMIDDLKKSNKISTGRYKKVLGMFKQQLMRKNQLYQKATNKKYNGYINKLRRSIKQLRTKLKNHSFNKENFQIVEKQTERPKQQINILQNILINPKPQKEEKEYDIDFLLNEMTVLPDLMRPFEDETLTKNVQTQTTRSTVTRPVQTDSLSTARKETQTFVRSSNVDVQCNLESVAPLEMKKELKSQSIQTEISHNIKDMQTMNLTVKSCSTQTNTQAIVENKITMKRAVATLKKSRQTFTISNGMLIHYSKNPMTSSPSSNESLIAKTVFRRLAKYIDTQYFGTTTDTRKRRRTSNILREIKQLERSRELMQLCRSGLAGISAHSDTESSGYESRPLKRAQCFEDLLIDGQTTPSGDSGILSEVEVGKHKFESPIVEEDVGGILDEMLVDLPNVISPIGIGEIEVEDDETTAKEIVREENQVKLSGEVLVEIDSKKKARKRPVNRMAMLKKGIKKCNQIKLIHAPVVAKEKFEAEVSLQGKNRIALKGESLKQEKVGLESCDEHMENINLMTANIEHSYAAPYNFNHRNKPPKKLIAAPHSTNFMIDSCATDIKCAEFDSLSTLDVAENVVISSEMPKEELLNDLELSDRENTSQGSEEQEAVEQSHHVVIGINEITTRSGKILKSPVVRCSSKIRKLSVDASPQNDSNNLLNQTANVGAKRKRGRPRKQVIIEENAKGEIGTKFLSIDNIGEPQEIHVDIPQDRPRKRPVNRVAMLKKGINKCNTVNVASKTELSPTTKASEDCFGDLSDSNFEKPKQTLNKMSVHEEFRRMRERCINSNKGPKDIGKNNASCSKETKPHLKADDILALLNNVEHPTATVEIDNYSPQSPEPENNPHNEQIRDIPSEKVGTVLALDLGVGVKANFYSEAQLGTSQTQNVPQTSNEFRAKVAYSSTPLRNACLSPSSPPKTVKLDEHESINMTPPTAINRSTTRSGKTYQLPKSQVGTSEKGCDLNMKTGGPSLDHTLKEETAHCSKTDQEQSEMDMVSRNLAMSEEQHSETDEDQLKIMNATFKQVKPALDKCVWLRGDARVCQEEVQMLKQVNVYKLVNYIIQYLKYDRGEVEKPNDASTSMEPLLTVKQKIMLGLLIRIERELNSKAYISQLTSCTEKYLLFSPCRSADYLENLSRFYTALCRFQQQKRRVRVFIADLLFNKPSNMFVIIYNIVTSWLNVLRPYKDISTDPGFEHVLAHIILTQPNVPIGDTVSTGHDNCVGVFKNLLVTYYKFPKEEQSVDDLMESLLESYMCEGDVQFETAILILCIHAKPQWAYGKIQLIAELCKVSTDEEVVRNLFKLVAYIGKKIAQEYKEKVCQLLTELLSHLTTANQSMELEDLKNLCLSVNAR